MVLMFGLLMSGLAYAHWEKIITITGSVATGSLDWEFTDAFILDTTGDDYHCRDNFEGPIPRSWMGDKDVGSSSIEITDPHTITITLTKVYPCYFTMASVYARNTGTIPLIIENVIIDETVLNSFPTYPIQMDLDDDGLYDIEIWWKDGFGTQVEPGDDSPEMSFWIHVLQDAPQGTTLNFTIELVAVNWNESVQP